jgi:hypothetical protein
MIEKLVSGGQTGADIAALDAALHYNFPHGGWCPKGRLSLDGPIPAKYSLTETPPADYPQRTEWNVRDSDGTVVFTFSKEQTGGSLKTVGFAKKHGKPCIHIPRDRGSSDDPALILLRLVGTQDHESQCSRIAGIKGTRHLPMGQACADKGLFLESISPGITRGAR